MSLTKSSYAIGRVASGLHRTADNDEPERIAADLERDTNKGEKLAARNDRWALDDQIQMQGYIGGLPR